MKIIYLKTGREKIHCKMYKTKMAKKVTISVGSDARVVVTLPKWSSYKKALDFLKEKRAWVLEQSSYAKNQGAKSIMQIGDRADYLQNKEQARQFVERRLLQLNSSYGLKYNKVFIRDQKSRWGSCSGKGNLNFNYRIIFLEADLADYLIVHELCHLEQMNHSKKFWSLVERQIPDYKRLAKTLRKI